MKIFMLIIFILSIINIHSTEFRDLRPDVFKNIIEHIPPKQIFNNVSLINKTYKDEIDTIKLLQFAISNNSINLDLIGNLTKKIQFSELFTLKKKHLINIIKKTAKDIKTARDIANRMNICTMSKVEYDKIWYSFNKSIPFKERIVLRLLILSSRVLAAPIWTLKCDLHEKDYNHEHFNFNFINKVYKQFPWILIESELPIDILKNFHLIYFSYLHEYLFDNYYQQLNIPKFDSIFNNNDTKKRSNLINLINKYSFNLLCRENLIQIRNSIINQNNSTNSSKFLNFVIEADRINLYLFWTHNHIFGGWEFMTQFILDIADYLCITSSNYDEIDIGNLNKYKKMVRDIIIYTAAHNYYRNNEIVTNEFSKLTKLLASSTLFDKKLIIDFPNSRDRDAMIPILEHERNDWEKPYKPSCIHFLNPKRW